ncbi:hypothetical protein [Virgibacillus kimchii]
MDNIGNLIQYQIYVTMQDPDPNRLSVIKDEGNSWHARNCRTDLIIILQGMQVQEKQ